MDYDPDLAWRAAKNGGFNSYVGPIMLVRRDEVTWNAALQLDERHLNFGGVCHGGVMLSLADVAMGAAAHEAADEAPCATIELNSHFIAAGKPGTMLLAEARLNRRAGGVAFMEAEIWSGGRKCLRASGIWKYLNL